MSTLIKRSFTGGEIAPAVQARVDTAKYEFGLKICRNNIVMRHGGVQNRAGTKLVGEVVPTAGTGIRLIPFILDSSNSYMLEFSIVNFLPVMRVIKNGAYIVTSVASIVGITQANPAVVSTFAPHGFVNGQEIFINGIQGMEQMNFRDVTVFNVTANTFQVKDLFGNVIDSTSFSAYIGLGTASAIYSTGTPFGGLVADMANIKYVQSAASMVFTQAGVINPVELTRVSDTNWVFSAIIFAPKQVAPVPVSIVATSIAGTLTFRYKVSAINALTGEESLPSGLFVSGPSGYPTGATNLTPNTLTWLAAPGASEYNIYRETFSGNGFYGLIGIATGLTFADVGQAATSQSPIVANNPIIGQMPVCACFYQQRLLFANGSSFPERVWGSQIGIKTNFGISRQANDDESLQFDMTGDQVNRIFDMINIGKLVVFASGSENSVEGNSNGVLTPTAINIRQYSQNGSANISPLVVGGNALYIQNQGSIVRDLAFEFQSDSYKGNDLTIFASHLFEGRKIVEWAWQNIPQSIVWCVLDDGKMIALTYIREQQIWAWHRHDTDGLVKHIAVIPEGSESFVYLSVQRTINGVVRNFTERMQTRLIDNSNIKDAVFSDCALTLDYRNTNPTAFIQLINSAIVVDRATAAIININSPNWLSGVPLQLKIFGVPLPPLPSEIYPVGTVFKFTSASGEVVTLTVTNLSTLLGQYVVVADKNIPLDSQGSVFVPASITNWGQARYTITGLWHLEGENVSVLADGFVEGSPNNSDYQIRTVVNGSVTFQTPYTVFQVGLPYISDMETLNIDSTQGETAIDKGKSVGRVTVSLENSRGGFFGPEVPVGTDPLQGMYELKVRDQELMQNPVALLTDYAYVNLQTEWDSNGRILIRQTEPLPISILAVAPGGFFPLRT